MTDGLIRPSTSKIINPIYFSGIGSINPDPANRPISELKRDQ